MTAFPHSIDIISGALLFQVSSEMDPGTTRRIAQFVHGLDELQQAGIIEIIPSYATIMVLYDDSVTSFSRLRGCLLDTWKRTPYSTSEPDANNVIIDVVYGGKYGEDLAYISAFSGKSVEEVITLHVSETYTVGAVGFSPGFTYLIGLPPELAVPRRSAPRLRVPAGSVGIGGTQTGVYALESSGGWNLLGRTPTRLFDPEADPPVRLKIGDRVEFRRIESANFDSVGMSVPGARGDGPIEVLVPGLQTTIQDLGRYGYARYGFATDGAADRASLVAANRLVGNPATASALEITHEGPSLRFHRRMRFGLAGADLGARLNGRAVAPGRRFETMPGDELDFVPAFDSVGARAYLAVAGGFDVPLALGSASTNLIARIGGWFGRALMRRDRLSPGQREVPGPVITPGLQEATRLPDTAAFRVMPGPQRQRFSDETWKRLLSGEFTVSEEVNRVGIRLLGPGLTPTDGADMLSEGIVTGSIQVTGEGQAIVMLPGHATIGGYTKIATVIPQDWDRLGQLSPGDPMYFREVD